MPLENKIYILLKDLPDAKAGTEFTLGTISLNREPYEMYIYGMYKNHQKAFDRETVENTPEWFRLKEEKVWTDSDMIEFAYEVSNISKESASDGLLEFKLIKNQTP